MVYRTGIHGCAESMIAALCNLFSCKIWDQNQRKPVPKTHCIATLEVKPWGLKYLNWSIAQNGHINGAGMSWQWSAQHLGPFVVSAFGKTQLYEEYVAKQMIQMDVEVHNTFLLHNCV